MKSTTIAALTALLSVGARAIPAGHGHRHAGRHADLHHNKREIIWETTYEVETVTILKTVYGDGSAPTDTLSAYTPPAPLTTTSTTSTTSPAAPLPTVVTSSYVAPAPTSTVPTSQAPAPSPVKSSSAAPAPVQSSSSAPAPIQYTSSVPPPAPKPEPTTATSVYQAPAPVTTAVPAPATSSAAAPVGGGGYPGAGSTFAGASYSGDFTYYDPGLGACGVTSVNTDAIVAISHLMFDPSTPNGNPNKNPLCGRKVTLTGKNGTPYTATVVDRCVGCALSDLDLTDTLFNTVTSNGDGRVSNMKWSWA